MRRIHAVGSHFDYIVGCSFIADPEFYPELVSIMATELNEVGGLERKESHWLQIMNAWINGVKDDYQKFIRLK